MRLKKIAIVSPSVMLSEREFNKEKWLNYLDSLGLEVEIMPTAFDGTRLETFAARDKAKDIMERKWPNSLYIAYFQSGTNTYGSVKTIKKFVDKLLVINNVVGISIATRPDCINEEIAKLLQSYTNRYYVSVELGLQTANENIGNLICIIK